MSLIKIASIQGRQISKTWRLGQEHVALSIVLAAMFVWCLTSFTSKLENKANVDLMIETITLNFEAPLLWAEIRYKSMRIRLKYYFIPTFWNSDLNCFLQHHNFPFKDWHMSIYLCRMTSNKHALYIPKATTCSRNSYRTMERNINIALQPTISRPFLLNLRGQGVSTFWPDLLTSWASFHCCRLLQAILPIPNGVSRI